MSRKGTDLHLLIKTYLYSLFSKTSQTGVTLLQRKAAKGSEAFGCPVHAVADRRRLRGAVESAKYQSGFLRFHHTRPTVRASSNHTLRCRRSEHTLRCLGTSHEKDEINISSWLLSLIASGTPAQTGQPSIGLRRRRSNKPFMLHAAS